MVEVEYLIIGAGPTGLGAAWALDRAGHNDWMLVEQQPVAGGLAGSCVDEHGFTWDFGGHVQFSHYPYFDRVMDDLLGEQGWLHHDREAWVWMHECFSPYPLQHNLHRLPPDVGRQCLDDIVAGANAKAVPAVHFGGWLEAQFGSALNRIFMRPYNLKVWAWPLEDMSWRWVGERVATLDAERVAANFDARRDDIGWGPNNRFRFPRSGGTGSIWRELARRLAARHPGRINLATEVVALDVKRRIARLADGRSVRYGALLSSIPLDSVVALAGLDARFATALGALAHSTTHVVGVGLHGQPPAHLASKCWIYFPEDNAPFYRVTVFSNYASANVPDPTTQWSLMTEVAESKHRPLPAPDVATAVVDGLVATGLISGRAAVHHVWQTRLEHGYPIPTLGRDAALAQILPALEEMGVYSRGRFGAWKYEVSNQDHSFAQGVELVERWLHANAETTLTLK